MLLKGNPAKCLLTVPEAVLLHCARREQTGGKDAADKVGEDRVGAAYPE